MNKIYTYYNYISFNLKHIYIYYNKLKINEKNITFRYLYIEIVPIFDYMYI
jgi:hypothetical protein